MATWHDLPDQIRLHILRLFSFEIFVDYVRSRHWETVPEDKHRVFTWPESPASLKSFSSAVRTCRLFRDALTRILSMRPDGISPYDLLREQQVSKLTVYSHDAAPNTIYIRDLYQTAGMFWKNSFVLKDSTLILDILEKLSPKSLVVMLPHLGSSILKHVIRMQTKVPVVRGWGLPIDVGRAGGRLTEDVFFFVGNWQIPKSWDSNVTICSLKARGKASSKILAEYPGLREMEQSREDTWWFIEVKELKDHWEPRKAEWVLVNYREKKIFGGSVKPVFFAWENIWEPESWRVIGEQSTLGEYWRKGRVDDSDAGTEDSDTGFGELSDLDDISDEDF